MRSFTDAETETLRALARKLKEDRDWNGTRLGEAMGVKQQNASRFVQQGSTSGIDRTTANALARAAGYRDVEHALLESGVLAEMAPLPTTGGASLWVTRDRARSFAKTAGYPDAAIDAVCHRYAAHDYTSKNLRWWMDRIVLEAIARKDEEPIVANDKPSPAKRSGTGR